MAGSLEARLAKMEARINPPKRPSPKFTPLPGPQRQALESAAFETLYGGAAGGGKSYCLLGSALRHRKSLILRRELVQVRGLVEESRGLVGHCGEFNASELVWRYADGRMLEFAACQLPEDWQKLQGRDHGFLGFDELTHFLPSQYLALQTWVRSTYPGERTRIMATANPDPVAGAWVVERWAPWLDDRHPNPAASGELRWFAMLDGKDTEVPTSQPFLHGGETITPRSRTFIQAKVQDNPHLMASAYYASLQALPEPLRSRMLHGSWTAGTEDPSDQCIPSEWVRLAQKRWEQTPRPELPMAAMGVDVARGGKDATTLTPRFGPGWFDHQISVPGTTTPDASKVLEQVIHAAQGHRPNLQIDAIGVGASVVDLCRMYDLPVMAIVGSERAEGTDKSGQLGFANLRAQLWWSLRERLDPALPADEALCLPPSRELLADLCSPKWKMTARGILIESKDEVRKRLGRSPDAGDSLVYALADAPAPRVATWSEWRGFMR